MTLSTLLVNCTNVTRLSFPLRHTKIVVILKLLMVGFCFSQEVVIIAGLKLGVAGIPKPPCHTIFIQDACAATTPVNDHCLF